MIPLFLGRIGLTELLVVLLIIVVCFGGKKIPELMRGMGRGVKAFREGLNGEEEPAGKAASDAAPAADEAKKPADKQ